MGLFDKLFGTRSQREIKKIQPLVDKILGMEEEYKALSEDALKDKTQEFKNRLAGARPWTISFLKHLPSFGKPLTVFWACAPTPSS